jgi:hypothetical protein
MERRIPDLDRMEGEWVAFLREKIIAHNKSFVSLMQEIEKYSPRKPSILLVPRKGEFLSV